MTVEYSANGPTNSKYSIVATLNNSKNKNKTTKRMMQVAWEFHNSNRFHFSIAYA